MVPINETPAAGSGPVLLPLSSLAAGESATILGVALEFALKERLAALGLRDGHSVRVVRRQGRKGPLQVRVGSTDVVIRAGDAECISVVRSPASGAAGDETAAGDALEDDRR